LVELTPKAFNAHLTRYAATPNRIEALHDDGIKKSYDLFEWSQMLQKQDGNSAGLYTFHYSDVSLKDAAVNFGKLMGSHEMMCHAESFEAHLPKINNPYGKTPEEAGSPHSGMIRIANEVAREILARGDADVYRLTENGVVKLDTFEALRPMCFAEYSDLAIKHKDSAGLDKWAAYKVKDAVKQAERAERKQLKNKGEEEL
jgi:hypothetical protein